MEDDLKKMKVSNILLAMYSLVCLSTHVCSDPGYQNDTSTKALVNKLKIEYGDVTVRPIRDHRQSVHVHMRMLLYELIEFNENEQKITIRSNMRLKWTDEYLQWNPSEWDNISNITLNIEDIWKPDLALLQNVDRDGISILETYVAVHHTGSVDWLFPAITTSACKINVIFFPYDIQQCNVTFYPWTLVNTQMRLFALNDDDALQERFVRNGIWNLTGFQPHNDTIHYKCCPSPFDLVVYTLTFARETAFFSMNIVIPALFLTVLMLVGFWLHPDSGEKITFTVTNLLALILFQQLVAEFMPPIGEPRSIIVTCFFILITLSVCSVILTVLVLHVYHKDVVSTPPAWAFWLLRIFIDRKARKRMCDFYKFLEDNGVMRNNLTSKYISDTVQPAPVSEISAPSLSESTGESFSLQECSFNLKELNRDDVNGFNMEDVKRSKVDGSEYTTPSSRKFKLEDYTELSNGFMWKHVAHAIDRAFGTILSFCMVGCGIYAIVAFNQVP